MIEGVEISALNRFEDDRGAVMHMLRADDPAFRQFGEIYFSTVHPGKVKAWRRHRRQWLNYAVPIGRILFVLYDDRPDSPTRGQLQRIEIGGENYCRVTVPPMIWNGFACLGAETALVANCATHVHDPTEAERLDEHDPSIPFRWPSTTT